MITSHGIFFYITIHTIIYVIGLLQQMELVSCHGDGLFDVRMVLGSHDNRRLLIGRFESLASVQTWNNIAPTLSPEHQINFLSLLQQVLFLFVGVVLMLLISQLERIVIFICAPLSPGQISPRGTIKYIILYCMKLQPKFIWTNPKQIQSNFHCELKADTKGKHTITHTCLIMYQM